MKRPSSRSVDREFSGAQLDQNAQVVAHNNVEHVGANAGMRSIWFVTISMFCHESVSTIWNVDWHSKHTSWLIWYVFVFLPSIFRYFFRFYSFLLPNCAKVQRTRMQWWRVIYRLTDHYRTRAQPIYNVYVCVLGSELFFSLHRVVRQ